jgi:putative phage-type endonuclease
MAHIIHDLAQGSPEWLAHRAKHLNASDAPVMLGMSPYTRRSDFLHSQATGIEPEYDEATLARFASGHRTEAQARPWAEEIIGDDLYPIVASHEIEGLPLGASYDGVTMSEEVIFEHKKLNAELAASLQIGVIPDTYKPQMEQQLMVIGAKRCLFMASNGSRETMLYAWYESEPAWRAKIIPGWKQFLADKAAYTPAEVVPAAVAAAIEALPAVQVRMSGSIAITDNLDQFAFRLKAFIDKLNMKPSDDQSFADAERAVKALEKAEEALVAAEAAALAETADIEKMRKTVANLVEVARTARLTLNRAVEAQKTNVRNQIVQSGKDRLAQHIADLNKGLGQALMPDVPADFAAAIKGKRLISTLRDAADTELARAKVVATGIADKIYTNLEAFKLVAEKHRALFADLKTLVLKAPEDFAAVVTLRVREAEEAAARREEEARARIAAEERQRLEAEQRAQAAQAAAPAPAAVVAAAAQVTDVAARQQENRIYREPAPAAGQLFGTAPAASDQFAALERRPRDIDIVNVLTNHFQASEHAVITWLLEMDFEAVTQELADEASV